MQEAHLLTIFIIRTNLKIEPVYGGMSLGLSGQLLDVKLITWRVTIPQLCVFVTISQTLGLCLTIVVKQIMMISILMLSQTLCCLSQSSASLSLKY